VISSPERPDEEGDGRPALAIRILAWDAGLAGAIAGMILADYGAQVTLVEPAGSSLRLSQWWPVVSRRTVTREFGPSSHGEELARLLAGTDAVIHAFRRGQAPVAQLDDPGSASSLVSCAITGFGQEGELSDLPALDLLASAATGRCEDQVGWHDGPSYLTHNVPSVLAGLIAVQGILAALIARGQDGGGQRVETSLAGAALAASEIVEIRGEAAGRGLGRRPRGTSPLYSLYECADGEWIQLGCLHAGFVNRAVTVLGIEPAVDALRMLPGFNDGVVPTTDEVRDPFYDAVAAALRTRPRDSWLADFTVADVPAAPVLSSAGFLRHPQARANGLTVTHDPSLGQVVQPGDFIRFAGRPPENGGPGQPGGQVARTGLHRTSSPGRPDRVVGNGPLAGIRVVEMTNLIAGPMAGRCLADLGATVIKLEPLHGDIFRQQGAPEFHPLNAGKLSLAMDVKSVDGSAAARRVVAGADVFLNNMRPGAADRLGLGYAAMSALNPGLIYCQISAFGVTGPLAGYPGGDPLAGALTGMQAAQGGLGAQPVYTYGAPIDYVSGFLAAAGVMIALHDRSRGGYGIFMETSLLDAGALLNAGAMTEYAGRGPRDDLPMDQYRRSALDGLYPTRSGWLALSIRKGAEWRRFASVLAGAGHGGRLPDDPSAMPDAELAGMICGALRTEPAAWWHRALCGAGVACVEVRSRRHMRLSDELIAASGLACSHGAPGEELAFIHRWLSLSGGGAECRGPAPGLGQHSQQVLEMFGIAAEQRARLPWIGVVADTH
jgi:crotonobetainyl-CoA:carnitine CoA-transferase CaiB-like acyl-CoA transferase